jgi:hypothetical protein
MNDFAALQKLESESFSAQQDQHDQSKRFNFMFHSLSSVAMANNLPI